MVWWTWYMMSHIHSQPTYKYSWSIIYSIYEDIRVWYEFLHVCLHTSDRDNVHGYIQSLAYIEVGLSNGYFLASWKIRRNEGKPMPSTHRLSLSLSSPPPVFGSSTYPPRGTPKTTTLSPSQNREEYERSKPSRTLATCRRLMRESTRPEIVASQNRSISSDSTLLVI